MLEARYGLRMSSAENPMPQPDQILIQGLELPTQIGVPDEERASWQSLKVDLALSLRGRVENFGDDLSATVDYDAVAKQVRALAADRPRKLIETLAAEMAQVLLETRPIDAVEVTIKKRILPGVDYVAVSIRRCRV
jgi:dihydroneopterin aldolase